MVAGRTRDCIIAISVDGAAPRCVRYSPDGGWLESAKAPRKRGAPRPVSQSPASADYIRSGLQPDRAEVYVVIS
jgi:hypothetical protein